MGTVKQPMLFIGSKGEMHLYALFDTGVKLSCISSEFVFDLGRTQRLSRPRVVNTTEGYSFEIRSVITLDFYLDDKLFTEEFLVVPNLTEEIIFGATTIQNMNIRLHSDKNIASL